MANISTSSLLKMSLRAVQEGELEARITSLWEALKGGLGADEERVFSILRRITGQNQWWIVEKGYAAKYGGDLRAHLSEELSPADLETAWEILGRSDVQRGTQVNPRDYLERYVERAWTRAVSRTVLLDALATDPVVQQLLEAGGPEGRALAALVPKLRSEPDKEVTPTEWLFAFRKAVNNVAAAAPSASAAAASDAAPAVPSQLDSSSPQLTAGNRASVRIDAPLSPPEALEKNLFGRGGGEELPTVLSASRSSAKVHSAPDASPSLPPSVHGGGDASAGAEDFDRSMAALSTASTGHRLQQRRAAEAAEAELLDATAMGATSRIDGASRVLGTTTGLLGAGATEASTSRAVVASPSEPLSSPTSLHPDAASASAAPPALPEAALMELVRDIESQVDEARTGVALIAGMRAEAGVGDVAAALAALHDEHGAAQTALRDGDADVRALRQCADEEGRLRGEAEARAATLDAEAAALRRALHDREGAQARLAEQLREQKEDAQDMREREEALHVHARMAEVAKAEAVEAAAEAARRSDEREAELNTGWAARLAEEVARCGTAQLRNAEGYVRVELEGSMLRILNLHYIDYAHALAERRLAEELQGERARAAADRAEAEVRLREKEQAAAEQARTAEAALRSQHRELEARTREQLAAAQEEARTAEAAQRAAQQEAAGRLRERERAAQEEAQAAEAALRTAQQEGSARLAAQQAAAVSEHAALVQEEGDKRRRLEDAHAARMAQREHEAAERVMQAEREKEESVRRAEAEMEKRVNDVERAGAERERRKEAEAERRYKALDEAASARAGRKAEELEKERTRAVRFEEESAQLAARVRALEEEKEALASTAEHGELGLRQALSTAEQLRAEGEAKAERLAGDLREERVKALQREEEAAAAAARQRALEATGGEAEEKASRLARELSTLAEAGKAAEQARETETQKLREECERLRKASEEAEATGLSEHEKAVLLAQIRELEKQVEQNVDVNLLYEKDDHITALQAAIERQAMELALLKRQLLDVHGSAHMRRSVQDIERAQESDRDVIEKQEARGRRYLERYWRRIEMPFGAEGSLQIKVRGPSKQDPEPAVVISELVKDGAAARAGLEPGNLITKVRNPMGTWPIVTRSDFLLAIGPRGHAFEGVELTIWVVSDEKFIKEWKQKLLEYVKSEDRWKQSGSWYGKMKKKEYVFVGILLFRTSLTNTPTQEGSGRQGLQRHQTEDQADARARVPRPDGPHERRCEAQPCEAHPRPRCHQVRRTLLPRQRICDAVEPRHVAHPRARRVRPVQHRGQPRDGPEHAGGADREQDRGAPGLRRAAARSDERGLCPRRHGGPGWSRLQRAHHLLP